MARTLRHQVMRCGNRPPSVPPICPDGRQQPQPPSSAHAKPSQPNTLVPFAALRREQRSGGQSPRRPATGAGGPAADPDRQLPRPVTATGTPPKLCQGVFFARVVPTPGKARASSLKSCTMIHPDTWMRARMSMRGWAVGCRPGRGYPPSPPSRQCGGSPARPGRPRPAPCGCERAGAPTPR